MEWYLSVLLQINLDSVTREVVYANMARGADLNTFEAAQKRIQALMDKDSYPRFISSDLYQYLLQQATWRPSNIVINRHWTRTEQRRYIVQDYRRQNSVRWLSDTTTDQVPASVQSLAQKNSQKRSFGRLA